MGGLLDLTRELVAIPSHADPSAIGDRIEHWLQAETAAAVRRDGAGNVFGVASASESSASAGRPPDLALIGHHDVVPPADSQIADDGTYRVRTEDGRLFGRGAADMKGALAAALLAFRDVTEATANNSGAIGVASLVGEERGGIGARHAIENGYVPEYAVVVEGSTGYSAPGVTDVAVAHRGRREARVVTAGTASHASESDPADNAIYRAADVLSALREYHPPETAVPGFPEHTLSGRVTPTEIEGGTAPNITPDACSVTIDERTVPGTDASDGLDRIDRLDGVRVEVGTEHPPMVCEDYEFAEITLEAAREEGPAEHVVKPHATDAGLFAANGSTTLVVGPAEPGEAHTEDESVSIDALHRCRRIYRRLMKRAVDTDAASLSKG